jgi:hypothetical protein
VPRWPAVLVPATAVPGIALMLAFNSGFGLAAGVVLLMAALVAAGAWLLPLAASEGSADG